MAEADDTKSPSARHCFRKSRRQKAGMGRRNPSRYRFTTLVRGEEKREGAKVRREGGRGWSPLNEDEESRAVRLFNIQG